MSAEFWLGRGRRERKRLPRAKAAADGLQDHLGHPACGRETDCGSALEVLLAFLRFCQCPQRGRWLAGSAAGQPEPADTACLSFADAPMLPPPPAPPPPPAAAPPPVPLGATWPAESAESAVYVICCSCFQFMPLSALHDPAFFHPLPSHLLPDTVKPGTAELRQGPVLQAAGAAWGGRWFVSTAAAHCCPG